MGYFVLIIIGIVLGTIGGWLQSEVLSTIAVLCCRPGALRLGWWFYKD